MLDASGNIVAKYEYSPFGQIVAQSGAYAETNPFRFSSEYHDDETALVYYNYRYYNTTLGRWLSRDPIEEKGGWNLYSMVGNNAISRWDWLGLDGSTPWNHNGLPDYPAGFRPRGISEDDFTNDRMGPDLGLSRCRLIAREILSNTPGHNDIGDARRHAEWQRRTTQEISAFTAWLAGTWHEIEGLLNGQPLDEALMDLNNNAEGRNAAREERSIDESNLITLNPPSPNQYNDDYYDNEDCPVCGQ
ncbi:MAG: RHS repeat-associated core domain-containing protein [Victivallales bacterium]|nr:RHS repeat-associated core domain-containing protein [Victivallales bacterium]